ncbi:hypothetical protein [Desulfatiglans anilini]|uniref:hypothetical protein n=1 Tax=Desulfatiglans anilini TaxID=90728 RepID=UPI00040515AB|nr:hypothetical protein [Desulfatiglans anilini]
MISESSDLERFIDAIKGMDFESMILAADKEALEAWREARKCLGRDRADRHTALTEYEANLKRLVAFLRYSVRRAPGQRDGRLFRRLCTELNIKKI